MCVCVCGGVTLIPTFYQCYDTHYVKIVRVNFINIIYTSTIIIIISAKFKL